MFNFNGSFSKYSHIAEFQIKTRKVALHHNNNMDWNQLKIDTSP